MKPPIFPPLTAPLPALDWHARARMFRDQALGMPDIMNGRPNWPRYFLLSHAAELAKPRCPGPRQSDEWKDCRPSAERT